MHLRTIVLAWELTLFPALAIPQSQPGPHLPSSVLVKADKVLDVRKASYIDDGAIWIEGERIREVGSIADMQAHAPKGAAVIDLGRTVVLPGLIDCHTHLMARFADIPDGYVLASRQNRRPSGLLREQPMPA